MADKIFRATKALGYRRGTIRKDGIVPSDYPRLKEGLRRGWIVEDSPATVISSEEIVEPTVTVPEVINEIAEVIPEPVTAAETDFEPLDPDPEPELETVDVRLIGDLDFLKPGNVAKLTEAGLVFVADLEGWTFEQLREIKGIGKSKANQLLSAYADNQ